MRYVVVAFKLLVVPAALAVLAVQSARDPRLGALRVDAWLLVAALLANQLALILFAGRMRLALRAFGIALTLRQAVRVHLQSMFYFFALPMSVGLEISRFAKVRALAGETANATALAYALLADRVLGAAAALALGVLLLPFVELKALVGWGSAPGWALAALAAAALAGALLLHPRIRRHAVGVAGQFRGRAWPVGAAFAVAIVTHCCFAFAVHLGARGADIDIGFLQSLFAISAAMLFVVLPVSFAGIGPVEAAGLGILLALGLAAEQAALFVLLSYLAKLLAAFQGAVWEVFEGGRDFSRLLVARGRADAADVPDARP